jgi:sugar lactone lactonase YvrE
MSEDVRFEGLVDARCAVAESPLYDERTGRLYFVDIMGRSLRCVELSSRRMSTWSFDSEVCSAGLCESGRLIVALQRRVVLFDPDRELLEVLTGIDLPFAHMRLNDGKVGPDGAFWVGSMDDREYKEPIAALYRVTPSGTVERRIDGFKVSNGLAWSADGRFMFHSDSRGPWIDRWRFNPATGALTERTRIAELDEAMGRPDGGATDLEGTYWSAGVSAGCLNRFDFSGRLLRRLRVPVSAPTMPCFGGNDARTLFVTSLRNAKTAAEPFAGGVLMGRMPFAGTPLTRFRDGGATR